MIQRREVVFGLAGVALANSLMGRSAFAAGKIKPTSASALIVVDVQNCFLPGGSVAVKDGDQVVPVINRIAKAFSNVVVTQEWHTPRHVSFASSHPGKKPSDVIKVSYGDQVLRPDHCLQGTEDVRFSKNLQLTTTQVVIRKGFRPNLDSRSAFLEADRKTHTGLAGYLKERGVKTIFVAGLAIDACVAATAIDGRRAGFSVYVVEDACRGVDANGSLAKAWASMAKAGAQKIQSSEIEV